MNALFLSEELCELCRDNKRQSLPRSSSQHHIDEDDTQDFIQRREKRLLKSTLSYKGMQEMVIDFVCREDLVITTLKEFFEIFISSIKKE